MLLHMPARTGGEPAGAGMQPQPGGFNVAKMCPIDACQHKAGLCIHDKMMIGMGVLAVLAAVGHWGLALF